MRVAAWIAAILLLLVAGLTVRAYFGDPQSWYRVIDDSGLTSTISRPTEVEWSLRAQNTMSQPVKLSLYSISCPCFEAELPEDPVGAGEDFLVLVRGSAPTRGRVQGWVMIRARTEAGHDLAVLPAEFSCTVKPDGGLRVAPDHVSAYAGPGEAIELRIQLSFEGGSTDQDRTLVGRPVSETVEVVAPDAARLLGTGTWSSIGSLLVAECLLQIQPSNEPFLRVALRMPGDGGEAFIDIRRRFSK